ncbi:MAG: cupin domain-containing protein [Acidobacteria bacterium]|nr:MAG: cupin domain-containing protein [Acidobacteriota bacterium]PYS12713.1 MAG: cupin domain-containing protein [Acidobacteriota bacterium]
MKQAQGKDVTKYRWADIPEEELNPLLTRKLITGDRVMLSELVLKKGCVVRAHHHENEQVSYVIRGTLKFEVNGREIILRAGDVLHIPSNVVHSATALEDTLDIDIFSPPRQDWLDGTDQYLRGK